ncbi:Leucine-rich repeat - like 10, partial [Theobroma cacao]
MQGYNIINSFLNACLLERSEACTYAQYHEHVKMHDVIRDMALWIACEREAPKKKFFVRARVGSIKALNVENWEGVRMSLADSGIEDLRGTPTCPNLQTLFLNGNNLKVIGDGFFQFMCNLRVLNLSSNWNLYELPEGILELVLLECLDLSWTGIKQLPIKLNRLSKLKYLDLTETRIQKIPRQLICKFSKLQTFKIDMTWLILAPNLTTLHVRFCKRIEEIISEDANVIGVPNPSLFAKLERLYLSNLPKLRSIYWDTLPFP